jgi:hypothetical protein
MRRTIGLQTVVVCVFSASLVLVGLWSGLGALAHTYSYRSASIGSSDAAFRAG